MTTGELQGQVLLNLALTRNRIIMRQDEGTEYSGEELQKQNDHGGVARTGPSEYSP
jgi:hypothetical protein